MSGIQHREGHAAIEIAQIREALGAIAAAEPAVLWVYRRGDGQWATRREGAVSENVFDSRDAAEADGPLPLLPTLHPGGGRQVHRGACGLAGFHASIDRGERLT